MITENELQMSNMSYTNRDFASIYPELLDLTKTLTNRWDPSISNESDPGNVLLKLAAAVGDKSNYNIDKNVLECFMPSATQETSMRMLTEAVGYNMRYYQSAMTDISFKYTGTLDAPITLSRFGTVVSNEDESVSYTLIQDVTLAYQNQAVSGLAIEGLLESLVVSDNEVIKLENLDDDNRIYFPETFVAENGVFITNEGVVNFEEWTRVDNLNTQQPLTRCYKFGFDSREELPYIEFPSDVAQLLGSGIRISYIVTTGDAGNISANKLTVLRSTVTEVDSSNLVIFNPASAVNGRRKETIDEAYNNFKKIIGTFDTLVTVRDYANAMYNLTDQYGKPVVSNAAATDRLTDFNHSLKVVSYDANGQYVDLIPSTDMTVSDLGLYPLKPYKGENYNIYKPEYVYDQSFKPLKAASGGNYTDDPQIVQGLDDLKCIGHTYKTMSGDAIDKTLYAFKNIAVLDVQIFTYAKVNVIAQTDIKNNVIKALSDNFNARKVDYGYEIPYDRLLDVIEAADSRIKSVSLSEPVYHTRVMYVDEEEEDLVADFDVAVDVAAKNVLAGKLSLFLFDRRFDWRFGQTDNTIYDNLYSITTSLQIPIAANTNGGGFAYTLDKNEVIQLIAPSLSTTTIYPAGVYYRLTSSSSTSPNVVIPSGSDYQLSPTQQILLYYVDSNEQTKMVTLSSGTVVKPSFDMYYTDDPGVTNSNTISVSGNTYVRINTNQSLEVRSYVTAKLTNLATPIYWIRNNDNNVLFAEGETTVMLDSNEYFLYSNSNLDDLVILGAGTFITRNTTDLSQWAITDTVSLENISVNGLNAFTTGDWQYKQFTASEYLELQEMQVVTLGAGTEIQISNWTGAPDYLDSTFVSCDGEISYIFNNTVEQLPQLFNIGSNWQIRTRLDIDTGPDKPQMLIANSMKTQSLSVILTSGESVNIEGAEADKCFLFNYPVSLAGGQNIDLLITNLVSGETSYALSMNIFNYVQPLSTDIGDIIDPAGSINISIGDNKTLTLPISLERFVTAEPTQAELQAGMSGTYNYQPFATYIVPILFDKEPTSNTALSLSVLPQGTANLYAYNTYTMSGNDRVKVPLDSIGTAGLYMLEIVANWQGEYETLNDLIVERPYQTTSETGTTIYPNHTGDICKVLTTTTGVTNAGPLGLYRWTETNSSTHQGNWGLISNSDPSNYRLTISATVDPTQESAAFLSIGKIYRIAGLNPALVNNLSGSSILNRIADLTRGLSTKFYYVYTPENQDAMEIDDITDAAAFWDVNNICNKLTIPQIDILGSSIYIARSSQL